MLQKKGTWPFRWETCIRLHSDVAPALAKSLQETCIRLNSDAAPALATSLTSPPAQKVSAGSLSQCQNHGASCASGTYFNTNNINEDGQCRELSRAYVITWTTVKANMRVNLCAMLRDATYGCASRIHL